MECPDCGYECLVDEVGEYYCPVCGLVYGPAVDDEHIILGYN